MREEFTKADLTNGVIVELRNGFRYMVMDDGMIRESGYMPLSTYESTLLDKDGDVDWDIMKTYRSDSASLKFLFEDENLECIWERKEFDEYDSKEYKVKTLRIAPNADTYSECNMLSSPIFIERTDSIHYLSLTYEEAQFLVESLSEIIEKTEK